MSNYGSRLPAVTPKEVVLLDQVLFASGRSVTGDELARRGRKYRLVDRKLLATRLLEMVDVFVSERIRQAERELGRVLEKREREAEEDGRHRVLVSLAEMADLVDSIVQRLVDGEGAVAAKALDRRIDRIFKTYGFVRVRTLGEWFDSRVHEAIDEREEPGAASGMVLEELSRGYVREDYVLRVARVVVAS